jgi:hypothetical protein
VDVSLQFLDTLLSLETSQTKSRYAGNSEMVLRNERDIRPLFDIHLGDPLTPNSGGFHTVFTIENFMRRESAKDPPGER